jgi:hypothetical protein
MPEFQAENIRRTKDHLSRIRFQERKHIRAFSKEAGEGSYVGAAEVASSTASGKRRGPRNQRAHGQVEKVFGSGGQLAPEGHLDDRSPFVTVETDSKIEGGGEKVENRNLPADVRAELVGVEGLDVNVEALGSVGLEGLGAVENLAALIDENGAGGADAGAHQGGGAQRPRATLKAHEQVQGHAEAAADASDVETFDVDEFSEEEDEDDEDDQDSAVSMSSDLLR